MYNILLLVMLISAIVTFVFLSFFSAPYGRYHKNSKLWNINLPNRLAWIIMESPAILFFIIIYIQGNNSILLGPLLLFILWQFHYLYRGFIYPLKLRNKHKKMPVIIVISAVIFNCLNAYLNAYWICNIGNYNFNWQHLIKYFIGAIIFFIGFFIHYRSDEMLIQLRKPGSDDYVIPQGFLFNYICSPNYLGEIIMWTGFAIASWSLAAALFVLFTIANLLPRSVSHLKWYREHFKDFPKPRKALIPFIL